MTQPTVSCHKQDDPFERLLGLEDEFYHDGFQIGQADGEQTGRIEGRVFGFEKGFEKAILAGRLHGRCAIWMSRLRQAPRLQRREVREGQKPPTNSPAVSIASDARDSTESPAPLVPYLPDNPRLARHVQTLHDLVNPVSLVYKNNEEAVSNFDDRLKRAEAKVRIIQRIVGENVMEDESHPSGPKRDDDHHADLGDPGVLQDREENIEDIKSLNIRR